MSKRPLKQPMSEPSAKTFKAAFCEHFQIAPEKFISAAVYQCLHPDAGFCFRLLDALQTHTAQESRKFIEQVGRTSADAELEDVISEYHNDVADHSTLLARRWNQRVSARKVAQINQIIRGRNTPGPDSTHFYRKDGSK